MKFEKGDVVVLPFPFSDLSSSKKRPALVVTNLKGEDLILLQITSNKKFDSYSINLTDNDFSQGKINIDSKIRPNKIFTADKSIILYKIGTININKQKEVLEKLFYIFSW